MPSYQATDTFLLGSHGEVQPGQDVPDTFLDSLGEEHKTDFDRLEELGVVERKAERPKRSAAKRGG